MLGNQLFVILQNCLNLFKFRKLEAMIIDQGDRKNIIFSHSTALLHIM